MARPLEAGLCGSVEPIIALLVGRLRNAKTGLLKLQLKRIFNALVDRHFLNQLSSLFFVLSFIYLLSTDTLRKVLLAGIVRTIPLGRIEFSLYVLPMRIVHLPIPAS